MVFTVHLRDQRTTSRTLTPSPRRPRLPTGISPSSLAGPVRR